LFVNGIVADTVVSTGNFLISELPLSDGRYEQRLCRL
jgi:hypothetical protein